GKVREAVFNMVGPYFDGGDGLDLCAGTGALGIEALSRGLDRVIFVDRSRRAIQVLRDNLDVLHLTGRGEVYRQDAGEAIKQFLVKQMEFDIIFIDPPYDMPAASSGFPLLFAGELLKPGAMLV